MRLTLMRLTVEFSSQVNGNGLGCNAMLCYKVIYAFNQYAINRFQLYRIFRLISQSGE